MVAGIVGFCVLLLLIGLGVPLGFAALLVGFCGFALIRGVDPAVAMTGQQILDVASHHSFAVIPLFILMGVLIHNARLSEELYEAGYAWLGHRKGGVAMSTVAASAAFSAVSGSSLATAATMTRVALPPLRKYGYRDSLSLGTIAAGGTLGILIPPSVPLIVYAIFAQQDVARLFMAGVVPGLIMTAAFILSISILCHFRPEHGPPGEKSSFHQRLRSLKSTWPIFLLVLAVLGGIYAGIFTPTEAAGVGAGFAAIYTASRAKIKTLSGWYQSLSDAAQTTATLFIVIIGSLVFTNFINLSGLPYGLVDMISEMQLSGTNLVIAIAILCILLGTVFETIGILVLIIPLFLPSLTETGVDLVWFGIVVVIVIEIGLITPPVGMNVFTVKAVAPEGADLIDIFRGASIFLVASLLVFALVLAFPPLALWLPKTLM